MPITVTLPQPNPFVGPGCDISLVTDFIGALPADTQWHLKISLGVETFPFWEEILTSNAHSASFTLMVRGNNKGTQRTSGAPRDGDAVTVTAELTTSSGVIDSGTATTTWSPTRALGQQQFLNSQAQAGGFTTDDRAALQLVEQSVAITTPSQVTAGLSIITKLLDVVGVIPATLMTERECVIYEGRGQITRPGGLLEVNAFGVSWRVTAIPSGFGLRTGAVDEYFERLGQLVVLAKNAAGLEQVDKLEDIHRANGTITWAFGNTPSRILYDVTPGCQLELCWLLI